MNVLAIAAAWAVFVIAAGCGDELGVPVAGPDPVLQDAEGLWGSKFKSTAITRAASPIHSSPAPGS